MKKTIALFIGAVSLLSVLIIGIFGSSLFADSDQIVVKATSIQFNHKDLVNDYNTVMLKLENGRAQFQLNWSILPEKTSNKAVEFIYQEKEGISVTKEGLIVFEKKGLITITIRTLDGTQLKDEIQIAAGAI